MAQPPTLDTSTTDTSIAPADRHAVRQEAMIAMLDRERRALSSSLIGMALLAAAFSFYPNTGLMLALLSMRFGSFLVTRRSAAKLLRAIRAKSPARWPRCVMVLSMALTGVTLGLLLLPPPPGTPIAAGVMVRAVVIVAVTLIAVTLAAMPRPRDAMLASFFLTVSGLALLQPGVADPALALVAALAVIGIRIYAANAGHHIVAAAEVLVEKRQLSEELAEALAHAEYLGSRDPLTGLLNRRKLFEQRDVGCIDGSRQLVMIDLDHFKLINDKLGHSAGDSVLIATAEIIRSHLWDLPQGDHRAFRLGGEEFLVILAGLDCDATRNLAESLRKDIAAIAEHKPDLWEASTTASFGIARWFPGEAFDDVLQRADAACYEAKKAGRNTVRAAA